MFSHTLHTAYSHTKTETSLQVLHPKESKKCLKVRRPLDRSTTKAIAIAIRSSGIRIGQKALLDDPHQLASRVITRTPSLSQYCNKNTFTLTCSSL